MIQTTVLDPSKRCAAEYAPPNHAAGEQWPGPERRPTKQLTLFGLCVENAPANTREAVAVAVAAAVAAKASATPRADDASDDEGWFFVKPG